MDPRRFDELTRAMAGATSRRSVLRGIAAGVAGALAGIRPGLAAKPTRSCIPGGGPCDADTPCCRGAVCAGGVCCPEAQACGGVCCQAGAKCVDGACSASGGGSGAGCPAGSVRVGRNCLLVAGQPCAAGSACQTGVCADGVCCDAACTGGCEACNVPGSVGTCTGLVGSPAPYRPACGGAGGCAGSCQRGTRAGCVYPGADTTCGDPACVADDAVRYACDGAGSCAATTTDCGLYQCRPDACLDGCQDDDDCLGKAYCADGACTADKADGQPCAGRDECASGYCVGGTCCGSDCPGTTCMQPVCPGGVCGLAPDATQDGVACAEDDVCGTGYVCQAGACAPSDPFCPSAVDLCHRELESCEPVDGIAICTWRKTCDECFNNGYRDVTPGGSVEPVICCDADRVCRALSGNPDEDHCCYDDEDCVNGACCNKRQHCEGKCCEFTCCNGQCCPEGEECLYDEPNGGVSCQPGRTCTINTDCVAPEYCTTGFDVDFCCPPDRQFQTPGGNKGCCPYGTFSGTGRGFCCEFPSLCQTYRSLQGRL